MCRSTTEMADFPSFPKDRDRLRIRAFHLHFTISGPHSLPEALTLVYLPRIAGNLLEINDAKIRGDAAAFVALHRMRSAEAAGGGEAVFGSADRVRAGEAVRFEVYVGAERAMKGVFRRAKGRWEVECGWVGDLAARMGIGAAEVRVVGERGVSMRGIVESGKGRELGRRRRGFCLKLEEIPEEGEEEEECECCGFWEGEEGEREWEMVGMEGEEEEEVMDLEGMKWAMDVGMWVVCLGVGLLVSKASYKRLRRKLT